ncbi:MAG: hypothetical protein NVS3B3_22120 [Aquirhabdus sp.]
MANGSLQSVLVCTSSSTATAAQQAICPKVGAQFYVPTKVQAYLLDPSQQNNIEAAVGPFDYVYAGGLWSLAFSTVVGLYFVSHGIGLALGMIRRG